MRQRQYGRIINISSVIGQAGSAGQANFAAAESALLGFTKSLAQENARHNITVNAIAPGFIQAQTDEVLTEDAYASVIERIPMRRMGQPEDVAAVVGFLAGQGAQYITGQVIGVNGGLYM
jgi:3-oxoacyl-[acyl-carrier protein] reductase